MQITIDDYRGTLISKILLAQSQEEVRSFIDHSMDIVKDRYGNGQVIALFLEKIAGELKQFDPIHKNPQQWSNIKMAGVHLNRLRQNLAPAAPPAKKA